MTTAYPGGIDSFTNPAGGDSQSTSIGGRTHSAMHADAMDAIEAIETELGTNPSGAFATVAAAIAAAGGSPALNPLAIRAGSWVCTTSTTSNAAYRDATTQEMHYQPFTPTESVTITGLGVEVTTLGSAGDLTARLCVYADASGVPGARLLDAGTVSVTSTGFKSITGLSLAVTAGTRYWLAVMWTGSFANYRLRAGTVSDLTRLPDLIGGATPETGTSTPLSNGPYVEYLQSGQNTSPATATPTTGIGASIRYPAAIWVKA